MIRNRLTLVYLLDYNILFSTIYMESSLVGTRTIVCYRHRNQIGTHICTDCKCTNYPILCAQCMTQQVNKYFHYDHEKSILPLDEAVENICLQIKSQVVGTQKLYKIITSKNEYQNIINQIERGIGNIELQQRINLIKNQIQLEFDLLKKQFQKTINLEKDQYFKMLDCYKKNFGNHVQYIKNHVEILVDFNNVFQYYGNKNNLYLKIVNQTRKKSDWILKAKKNIQLISKNLQNNNYQTQLINIFNSPNRIKLDVLPTWKRQQNGLQRYNELKSIIKKIMSQWIVLPEIKTLEETAQSDNMGFTSPPVSGTTMKNYVPGMNLK